MSKIGNVKKGTDAFVAIPKAKIDKRALNVFGVLSQEIGNTE